MVLAAFTIRMVVALCVFRVVAAPTIDHNEFGWEMGWTARSIALGRGSCWWHPDRVVALRYLIVLAFFPVTYYLTHSSMDYREPIEPEILILITVGIFGLDEAEQLAEEPAESLSTPEMAEV
jgi:hypothetical protein